MSQMPIQTSDVGIRFRLYLERVDTLKETLINFLKRQRKYRNLWAVRNVSFSVKKGESVAIVGRNGSGKSTLLKIIAGVFAPTEGECSVQGAVAPLIELGAGFNGELTGRENVFLNSAILGRNRSETAAIYDSIVEFAELSEFMDVPVKNYSSGMYARLGFAIATAVDADVLLMDEVLAVGDEAFQHKCVARLEQQLSCGKTIVFVSHDAATVARICQRTIVLDHGKLIYDGPTQEALGEYRRILAQPVSTTAHLIEPTSTSSSP